MNRPIRHPSPLKTQMVLTRLVRLVQQQAQVSRARQRAHRPLELSQLVQQRALRMKSLCLCGPDNR
jgi:hypothetical protein